MAEEADAKRIAAITAIAVEVFSAHGTPRDVARVCSVSHETIRRWLAKGRDGDERYSDFAAQCDAALTKAKLRTWSKAEDKDPRWVLVVRHGVKDAPNKHELSGPGGKPIETKATRDMTEEELVALAMRLHSERGDG